MKRRFPLFFAPMVLALLTGCGEAPEETGLSLYRESFCQYGTLIDLKTSPLKTFHRVNENDVPYVALDEFLTAFAGFSDQQDDSFLTSIKDGLYQVSYVTGGKEYPLLDLNAKTNEVTLHKGYLQLTGFYFSHDPFADDNELVKVEKAKTKATPIWNERTFSLSRYGFDLVEKQGMLYAPAGLFAELLGVYESPEMPSPLVYNGKDFFFSGNTNNPTCFSGEGKFYFADTTLLYVMLLAEEALTNQTSFLMSPIATKGDEAYHFESAVIPGKTLKLRSTGEEIAVPSLKLDLVLTKDGKGTYKRVNAATGVAYEEPKLGIVVEQTFTFRDDETVLHLTESYPNPFTHETLSTKLDINKDQTYFLKKTRTKEYAQYDYNVTRLHFGEFYGLRTSHPEVMDVDHFFAPYKKEILSEDLLTYNLGMVKLLYSGVDDGHTKIKGFTTFDGNAGMNAYEKEINDAMGPRRRGLFNLRDALQAYRKDCDIDIGYEVVDEAAYITFDQFAAMEFDKNKFTQDPDAYADDNSIALFYTALQDTALNHPEVERVIIDLTCNGGGMAITIPTLLAFMGEDVTLKINNYYTGDLYETHYTVEVPNYGDDYEFYILTSPFSFSCGNLLPAAAQYNGFAKIIGAQSGGGGSMVDNVYTPSGFAYTTSSLLTMLRQDKDGKMVEADDGVPVDLSVPSSLWYHRAELNKLLDEYESGN